MAGDTVAINLKVLSPSSEIEGGIHLQDLPASTTVGQLRLRIQEKVASRPGPERMRLIYRGKVVANDADTLETVFGADNLRESKDQSLHLVLRELPQPASTSSTPVQRTATAPPNPVNPPQAPTPAGPPLHTNPFRAIPQPRPNSQPPPAALPHHHHPHHHHAHHPHVHHHHHVQQPLNPLGPLGALPLPPQMQQQIAQALGQRGATPPAPGIPAQPADGPPPQTAPAPAEGAPAPAQPPVPGMLPGFAGLPAPNGRTVRQEGIGPNGARWSVTYNDFTANIPLRPGQPTMQRPAPLPPAFAVPPRPSASPSPAAVNLHLSWLLPRLRETLQEAARDVDNVRTLLAPSAVEDALSNASGQSTFPSWRAERIREHLRAITRNLDIVEASLSAPAVQLNVDVIALRQAAGEVRRQANEFSRALDGREAAVSSGLAQATSPNSSTAASADPLIATASAASQTLPATAPPELFLLSSPQGPVGVLFDQRGTYTTAPFTSSSASQAFVNQFNNNRQLIASLGQQIAQSSLNLNGRVSGLQPTPTQPAQSAPVQPAQPAQPVQQPEIFDQAAAQRVIQNIIQNRNERQAEHAAPANPNAPAENDRVANIAGHLWLVFKLACFVYIFAGGGGWYRPLMLGSIAVIVYIVQLGVFEAQLNVIRQHFEALLPNVDRIVQANNRPDAHANAPAPAPGRNMTPEEAARRLLVQQRNNQVGWMREGMRTLERGVALFVASLWPGIGERMVHAQEERERLERVAAREEQERREEEERRAAEAREEKSSEEKSSEEKSGEEKSGEEKSGEDPQSEKHDETHPSTSPSTSTEKPTLHRNTTQTLSPDFMDDQNTEVADASSSGGNTTAKGKERAFSPTETQDEKAAVGTISQAE